MGSSQALCLHSYALTSNGIKTLLHNKYSVNNGPKKSRMFPMECIIDRFVANIFAQKPKHHHHYATSPRLFEQNRKEFKSAIDFRPDLESECHKPRKKRKRWRWSNKRRGRFGHWYFG